MIGDKTLRDAVETAILAIAADASGKTWTRSKTAFFLFPESATSDQVLHKYFQIGTPNREASVRQSGTGIIYVETNLVVRWVYSLTLNDDQTTYEDSADTEEQSIITAILDVTEPTYGATIELVNASTEIFNNTYLLGTINFRAQYTLDLN